MEGEQNIEKKKTKKRREKKKTKKKEGKKRKKKDKKGSCFLQEPISFFFLSSLSIVKMRGKNRNDFHCFLSFFACKISFWSQKMDFSKMMFRSP